MRLLRWIRAGVKNVSQNLRVVWLPCALKLGCVLSILWIIAGRRTSLSQLSLIIWSLDCVRPIQPPIPVEYASDPEAPLYFAYFILEIFLDAAIVASLAATVLKCRSFSFFRFGIHYFGRFLRIALLASTPTICLILVLRLPLWNWGFSADTSFLITVLTIFAVDVIADYARVQTVLEERTCMCLSWLSACRFVWQNGRWVIIIASLKFLSVINALEPFTPGFTWLLIGTLWIRIWLKAVTFGTQIELVRETTDGPKLFPSSIAGEIREPPQRGRGPEETTKLA